MRALCPRMMISSDAVACTGQEANPILTLCAPSVSLTLGPVFRDLGFTHIACFSHRVSVVLRQCLAFVSSADFCFWAFRQSSSLSAVQFHPSRFFFSALRSVSRYVLTLPFLDLAMRLLSRNDEFFSSMDM